MFVIICNFKILPNDNKKSTLLCIAGLLGQSAERGADNDKENTGTAQGEVLGGFSP